jgi:hypothetical protein
MVLISTAMVNLFTKSVATISGLIFAGVLFVVFTVSEQINKRKLAHTDAKVQEHFQLLHEDTVERESIGVRPGNILITARDYNTLNHLRWVMERVNTKEQDVVCMAGRITRVAPGGSDLATEQIFGDYEQTLFTRAVAIAEKYGKHISLLVVPAVDIWFAIVQTANSLESSAVVAGLSTTMTAPEQAFRMGRAWEAAPEPKRQFVLHVVHPDMTVETFRIGPHTPTMRPEDVQLVHRMWLDITQEPGLDKLHHADIVSEALSRFAREYTGPERERILKDLQQTCDSGFGHSWTSFGHAQRSAGGSPVAPPALADSAPDTSDKNENNPKT